MVWEIGGQSGPWLDIEDGQASIYMGKAHDEAAVNAVFGEHLLAVDMLWADLELPSTSQREENITSPNVVK